MRPARCFQAHRCLRALAIIRWVPGARAVPAAGRGDPAVLLHVFLSGPRPPVHRYRHPDHDLHHARMGVSTSWSAWPVLLDLGYVAFYAVGAYSFALLSTAFRVHRLLDRAAAGRPACRVLGRNPRASRCFACAATISPSSLWHLVKSSAWCCSTGMSSPAARTAFPAFPSPRLFGLEFSRGEGGFADFFGLEYDTIAALRLSFITSFSLLAI